LPPFSLLLTLRYFISAMLRAPHAALPGYFAAVAASAIAMRAATLLSAAMSYCAADAYAFALIR